jgi:two-component system response regulator (stage 0 sporulation protein A)
MHKVLIADASEDWREQLERMLDGAYQVRSSGDGDQILRMIPVFQPDVLVLDLMLQGTDGLRVVKVLHDSGALPRVIVTGRYFSNFVTGALERYQVDSVMLKPCSLRSVAERVEELLAEQTQVVPLCQDPFDYITALLVRLNAPASQQGFRLLRRGIQRLMENPNQQLTKHLYHDLAKEFSTSATNVEKALRTTVTTAWNRRRDEVWRLYFPPAPTGQIPKPTAGQFLIRLSDVVRSALRRQA